MLAVSGVVTGLLLVEFYRQMMTVASPKGRRSAPPKLAQTRLRALTGMAQSVFPFSARWRLSRDCCAANHLELVARETNVSIARLSEWRERALAGAATALKERERDDRDDEIARLKSKVGEITMDNQLLYAKIAVMEGKRPLAHRRSRR
jgi:transposase